jgi:uncharacterized protein (TIGR04255 family)
MKYSKAPISEVIMGISYQNAKIPVDLVLKNALFSEEFPMTEIVMPLVLETLQGFQIHSYFNQNVTGPFLIRRKVKDSKWLLQIQGNMIYLNWIRLDTEPVGTYVGFSAIKDKFSSLLSVIEAVAPVNLRDDIALCDLTYHDRVIWQSEITDLSQIGRIMNINTPPKFSEQGYNNIFSRFTFHDSELNGFGLININTDTAVDGQQQLIKVESNLRGAITTECDVDTWFERAHTKQNDIFEQIFKEEIKAKWR